MSRAHAIAVLKNQSILSPLTTEISYQPLILNARENEELPIIHVHSCHIGKLCECHCLHDGYQLLRIQPYQQGMRSLSTVQRFS